MVEDDGSTANDDTHTRFAMAQRVLHGWIDARGSDCKGHTNKGAPPPALNDQLAIFIGDRIAPERGARKFPNERNVRRHSIRIVGKHGAQNSWTDTGALSHGNAKLRAGAAIFVANGGKAGSAPCI